MKRRESRQLALELIFEGSFHAFESPELIYDTAKDVREFEDDEYVRKLFFGVCEKLNAIDELISGSSKVSRRRSFCPCIRTALFSIFVSS